MIAFQQPTPIERVFLKLRQQIGSKIKLTTLFSFLMPHGEREYRSIIEKTGMFPWQYKELVSEKPKTSYESNPNHLFYRSSDNFIEQAIRETLSDFKCALQPVNNLSAHL